MAATIALASCAPGGGSEDSVGLLASALVGGTIDEGDLSVVALLRGQRPYCSGVLVGEREVLTAGHCIDDVAPDAVLFGTSPRDMDTVVVAVASTTLHADYQPSMDGTPATRDLGLIELAVSAPAAALPLPVLDRTLAAAIEPDARIRLIGFGSEAGGVFKRTGFNVIDRVDDDGFMLAGGDVTPCDGDSGGPALLQIDGQEHIVGIASAAEADCLGSAWFARTDADDGNLFVELAAAPPATPDADAGVPVLTARDHAPACTWSTAAPASGSWIAGLVGASMALAARRRARV